MEAKAKEQVSWETEEQAESGLLGEVLLYGVTAFAQISLHSLRTCYSFSKSVLHGVYHYKKEMLGIIDQAFILSMAVGMLLNALVVVRSPRKCVILSLVATGLLSLLLPLFVQELGRRSFGAVLALQFVCGLAQSFVWPNVLCIFNTHRRRKDAALLGLWISAANVGNICGFLLCQVSVIWLQDSWKIPFEVSAVLVCLSGLSCLLLPDVPSEISRVLELSEEHRESEVALLLRPGPVLCTVLIALYKSMNYGLLLWLPLLFTEMGLSQYSSLVPIAFDSSSVLGAVVVGEVIEFFSLKFGVLTSVQLLVAGMFAVLYFLHPSLTLYFLLLSLVGFGIGGVYNTLVGYITIQIARKSKKKSTVKVVSATTMFVANTAGALTQLLVGCLSASKSIFKVFLGYSVLACVLGTAVYCMELRKASRKEELLNKGL